MKKTPLLLLLASLFGSHPAAALSLSEAKEKTSHIDSLRKALHFLSSHPQKEYREVLRKKKLIAIQSSTCKVIEDTEAPEKVGTVETENYSYNDWGLSSSKPDPQFLFYDNGFVKGKKVQDEEYYYTWSESGLLASLKNTGPYENVLWETTVEYQYDRNGKKSSSTSKTGRVEKGGAKADEDPATHLYTHNEFANESCSSEADNGDTVNTSCSSNLHGYTTKRLYHASGQEDQMPYTFKISYTYNYDEYGYQTARDYSNYKYLDYKEETKSEKEKCTNTYKSYSFPKLTI